MPKHKTLAQHADVSQSIQSSVRAQFLSAMVQTVIHKTWLENVYSRFFCQVIVRIILKRKKKNIEVYHL